MRKPFLVGRVGPDHGRAPRPDHDRAPRPGGSWSGRGARWRTIVMAGRARSPIPGPWVLLAVIRPPDLVAPRGGAPAWALLARRLGAPLARPLASGERCPEWSGERCPPEGSAETIH